MQGLTNFQSVIRMGLYVPTQRLCGRSVATAAGYANGLGVTQLLQPLLR